MDEDKNSSNLPPVNNAGSVSAPLSPDVPNAAGRVIASTPEVVAPVVSDSSDTKLAHPFFAHHPTQTFNTDTGDIILNTGNPKPKQNKRPFIIGGIILAAVVIVITAVMIAISGRSSEEHPSHSASDVQVKFNQYASYMLYGRMENSLAGTYDPYLAYELDNQLSADGIDETYWDTAKNLLSTAIETYAENVGEDDTLTFLRFHQQNLQFLQVYRSSGDLSEDSVIAKYISSGLNATKEYLVDFYADVAESGSSYAAEYASQRISQYQAFADILEYYKNSGCLSNDEFNDACINELVIDDELYNLWSTVRTQKKSADTLLQETIQNLENNCWVISAQLSNNGVAGNE